MLPLFVIIFIGSSILLGLIIAVVKFIQWITSNNSPLFTKSLYYQIFFFLYVVLCIAVAFFLGKTNYFNTPNGFVYGGMLYFPIAIIATASISLILFPLIWFIEWLQKDSNERPIFVEEAQKEIEAVKCLLSSHDFISNTPADIIAKARGNLAEMESKLEELQKPHK